MRQFRRTTLITIFCLAVLAGLELSRKISFEPAAWTAVFLPVLFLLKRKNRIALVLVVLLGLLLGLWRGSIYMARLGELKLLSGQQVTIEASAITDSVYAAATQLEFTVNHARLLPDQTSEKASKELTGNFKVSGFGEAMIYRGDKVRISGRLYPMRGANQARIAYAQLKRTGLDNSWINGFTRRFTAGMQNALPEPNSSFGLGLLIGQRTTLSRDIINQLTMVGLLHIVAVSGYNLTILVRASNRLKLRSKYQKLMLSLSLIAFFILMTGFSASIVRAATVSLLSLWAWYYGRKIRPVLILAFTAALTALFNPFYIWGDLGWYLSFLAFFGVLVVAPIIAARLFKRRPKMLMTVLIETLSAEIMTLPLIMAMFGKLSLVALFANVLVVPMVPFAMLLGAIATAAGTWLTPFAGWFAWPANVLMSYMLDIVRLLSRLPHAYINGSINIVEMLALYGLVLFILLFSRRAGPRRLLLKDKRTFSWADRIL